MRKAGGRSEETVHDALVRELQWLRKGEGVTLRRLSCAPGLLTIASGDPTVGETRSEQAIHAAEELLRQGLDGLGHGLGAQALRSALAVDLEDPLTLTQRRCDFAEQHNKHPDTVESYENRAIRELALRIERLAGPQSSTHEDAAAEPGAVSLIRSNDDLVAALLDVVETAEQCLATAGSRSRDAGYLQTIERRVEKTGITHYRVLCGPPHWSVLKDHLRRLLEIKATDHVGGNQRMFIGLVSDFSREPERFLCANERQAVVVLPSLNGVERYDTALGLTGAEFGMAYVRLVQELYAGARPIETEDEVAALAVVRES